MQGEVAGLIGRQGTRGPAAAGQMGTKDMLDWAMATEQAIGDSFQHRGPVPPWDGPEGLSRDATRNFLHAVIAGAALVAHADGIVLSVEKRDMEAFIRRDRRLAGFDAEGVEAAFRAINSRLDQDPEAGRREALEIVARLRNDAALARDCLEACCTVAAADDLLDEAELRMLVTICHVLGLDADDLTG